MPKNNLLTIFFFYLETIENNQFVLLNFTAKNNTLTSTKVGGGDIDETMILGGIEIYGIDHKVVQVFLNQLPVEFDYDSLKVVSYYYYQVII